MKVYLVYSSIYNIEVFFNKENAEKYLNEQVEKEIEWLKFIRKTNDIHSFSIGDTTFFTCNGFTEEDMGYEIEETETRDKFIAEKMEAYTHDEHSENYQHWWD